MADTTSFGRDNRKVKIWYRDSLNKDIYLSCSSKVRLRRQNLVRMQKQSQLNVYDTWEVSESVSVSNLFQTRSERPLFCAETWYSSSTVFMDWGKKLFLHSTLLLSRPYTCHARTHTLSHRIVPATCQQWKNPPRRFHSCLSWYMTLTHTYMHWVSGKC